MQGLVEEYGAIPKGMNAERDIQVPKKTSEKMYVSYADRQNKNGEAEKFGAMLSVVKARPTNTVLPG